MSLHIFQFLSILGNCSRTIVSMDYEQVITSPNYPQGYPDNSYCTFHIFGSSDGRQSVISFTDFATESGHDFVQVRVDGVLKGEFSGIQGPSTTFRFFRSALIVLNSDLYNNDRGFRATVKKGMPNFITCCPHRQKC